MRACLNAVSAAVLGLSMCATPAPAQQFDVNAFNVITDPTSHAFMYAFCSNHSITTVSSTQYARFFDNKLYFLYPQSQTTNNALFYVLGWIRGLDARLIADGYTATEIRQWNFFNFQRRCVLPYFTQQMIADYRKNYGWTEW